MTLKLFRSVRARLRDKMPESKSRRQTCEAVKEDSFAKFGGIVLIKVLFAMPDVIVTDSELDQLTGIKARILPDSVAAGLFVVTTLTRKRVV